MKDTCQDSAVKTSGEQNSNTNRISKVNSVRHRNIEGPELEGIIQLLAQDLNLIGLAIQAVSLHWKRFIKLA